MVPGVLITAIMNTIEIILCGGSRRWCWSPERLLMCTRNSTDIQPHYLARHMWMFQMETIQCCGLVILRDCGVRTVTVLPEDIMNITTINTDMNIF